MSTPIHKRLAEALTRFAVFARASEQSASIPVKLSPLQARLLVVLDRLGPLRIGALATELMVAYGTASEAITSLEEKGLISKATADDDHRAVIARLTRRGRSASRRAADWTATAIETVVRDLAIDDAGALLAGLIKLLQALEHAGAMSASRMCVSCKHFAPGAGSTAQPHYCHLLQAPIGGHELRVDCPEHERASAEQAQRAFNAFHIV